MYNPRGLDKESCITVLDKNVTEEWGIKFTVIIADHRHVYIYASSERKFSKKKCTEGCTADVFFE